MRKYISQSEVLEWLGVSRQTLQLWIRAGKFPRRVRLGGYVGGWIHEEIEQWEQQRIAEREATA